MRTATTPPPVSEYGLPHWQPQSAHTHSALCVTAVQDTSAAPAFVQTAPPESVLLKTVAEAISTQLAGFIGFKVRVRRTERRSRPRVPVGATVRPQKLPPPYRAHRHTAGNGTAARTAVSIRLQQRPEYRTGTATATCGGGAASGTRRQLLAAARPWRARELALP